jgi:hypothetical protein
MFEERERERDIPRELAISGGEHRAAYLYAVEPNVRP